MLTSAPGNVSLPLQIKSKSHDKKEEASMFKKVPEKIVPSGSSKTQTDCHFGGSPQPETEHPKADHKSQE